MDVHVAGAREGVAVAGRGLSELEHVLLQAEPPRDDEQEDRGEGGQVHLGPEGCATRPQAERPVARGTPAPRSTAATATSQSSSADTSSSNGSEKTKKPTSLPWIGSTTPNGCRCRQSRNVCQSSVDRRREQAPGHERGRERGEERDSVAG